MTQTEHIGNLILSLRIGEPLRIGDVVITILCQKSRGNFSVAVEAPKEVRISRE